MWERLRRRNTERSGVAAPLSGALSRVGGPFVRQETKHVRTTYGGPVGLGLGALALVATVSVVLVLRRRAARPSSPVAEESNGEAIEATEES
jgi:hypothetical protein